MGGRRLVPIVTALLVVVAMSAASAAPAERPVERRGFGGEVSTTTPAGGTTEVTSGKVPTKVETIDVLLGEEVGHTFAFKLVAFTLMQIRSKAKRTVACAVMAAHTLRNSEDELHERDLSPEDVGVIATTRALAYAAMCMRLARLMAEIEAEQPVRPARAAPARCDVAPIALKVRTERTEEGDYRLVPVGHAKDGTKALPAKVTCKGTARTMTVRVKAKNGTDIRKAMLGKVKVGVVSPSTAEDEAHITVGFKKR